jgi:hypothetical protein
MAAHIAAYADFGARGRLQMEMRVKARDALQLIQRKMKTRGQRTELVDRQVAVPVLNRSQLVKDGGMMHGPIVAALYVFFLEGVYQAKTLARAAHGAL